jgi:AraC-like DNA-binding protein
VLHSQFRESLRVFDRAAEAGAHPVHLAREFRAQEKQTPGDYVQRLRVRAACDLLGDRDTSLAGVAADCGFSDQSHFTRTFKDRGREAGWLRPGAPGPRAVCALNIAFQPRSALTLR